MQLLTYSLDSSHDLSLSHNSSISFASHHQSLQSLIIWFLFSHVTSRRNKERNTTKAKPSTTQNPNSEHNYQGKRCKPILLNHYYRTLLSQNTIPGQSHFEKQWRVKVRLPHWGTAWNSTESGNQRQFACSISNALLFVLHVLLWVPFFLFWKQYVDYIDSQS